MKQKRVLSRFISAFVAVIMLIGIMPIISSADDGVILSYTFDKEEPTTVSFSDAGNQTLYKYDGKDFTFLRALEISDSVWNCGWFNYDTDRKGVSTGVPTHNETFVNDGELHIKLAKDNFLSVRIPGAVAGETYNVSLNVSGIDGNGLSILVDNNNSRPGGKPPICSTNIGNLYSGNFDYQSGDFIKIQNTTDGNLIFAIDNLLIKKHTPATATVTGSMPASGTKNVSTYIKPSVTFDNYVTDDIVNGIEVYNGTDKISAAATKTGETTVSIAPSEPLPGNANIEIRIPNNSPVTFTTDDEGVLLHYTFDTEKSSLFNENTFYSYDGKEYTFLNCDLYGGWSAGWFSKDGGSRFAPTKNEVYIADGKLNVNVAANNWLGIRIPDTDVVENQEFAVTFTVTNLSGDLEANLTNDNGKRDKGKADYCPLTCTETNGVRNYSAVFNVMKGDILKLTATGETTFKLDDLIVKKYVKSPVKITGTFPEQNRENVPTYVDPTVTFDSAVTLDYANGIKILDGTNEIETTNTLSSDGKTVTLKTSSQLPANSLITVKADDNNSFTFTTGDRNVALFENFETGKNDDANLGTIYGFGQYPHHSAKELAYCEQLGSRAIKFTFTDWGSASINLSPKVFGGNVNRRFKVSFDYYTDGSTVEAKLDGTGYNGGTKFVPTLTSGKKQHVEAVTGTQTLWAGAIFFQNSTADTSEVTLYIDNIRVEDITENAWADIVWHVGNSLIMASSSTEKTNQMWTGMNGKTLTAKYNNLANLADGTYKGYIAVYSGDTLVGAAAADIIVAGGATNDTVVIALPAEGDTGAFSVKAFLWNSEMTPIIEPTVLYNVK